MSLPRLLHEISACTVCSAHLPLGPRPVVRASQKSKILIIGQAPGTKVHETGIPWNDASGERLRDWLGLSPDAFYDEQNIAIMPMGFCYPGKTASADAPPRPECAPLWHNKLRAKMPNIALTLLVGQHAQKHYLGKTRGKTMTETVANFEDYGPQNIMPLPHPSWRVVGWQRKNPWFEADLLPALRKKIRRHLSDA